MEREASRNACRRKEQCIGRNREFQTEKPGVSNGETGSFKRRNCTQQSQIRAVTMIARCAIIVDSEDTTKTKYRQKNCAKGDR